MDIQANERGNTPMMKLDAGFFDHLARRGVEDRQVLGLDMTTRQQPAIQPAVVDKEDGVPPRMNHQAGGCDMSRDELRASQRSLGMLQKMKGQFLALPGAPIGGIRKCGDYPCQIIEIDHA